MVTERLWSYIAAWVVLLLLLGLSIGSAFLGTGRLHLIVNLGIAATQAAIVLVVFMRLRSAGRLNWLFAAAGFVWLALFFGIAAFDYLTRAGWPIAQ